MKITKLYIEDFQQFKNITFDFTYPKGHVKEGQPLEKVCFIGKNGTGKSTLLRLIKDYLVNPLRMGNHNSNTTTQLGFEFEFKNKKYFSGKIIGFDGHTTFYSQPVCFELSSSSLPDYQEIIEDVFKTRDIDLYNRIQQHSIVLHRDDIRSIQNDSDFMFFNQANKENYLIFSTNDGKERINHSHVQEVEQELTTSANLNMALNLFRTMPYYHEISFRDLKNFWSLVIYQVKKTESDKTEFQNKEENINRTIKEVNEEFEILNPNFLKILSDCWNVILEIPGIYFDYKNAIIPVQLNENLVSYFKIKNNDSIINYSLLSTGIKHLLIRLGYLTALFYKKSVKSSIALFDEPELGLYPDILYEIIDLYVNISPSTQYFFATHSPIVAAQFDPAERILLEFDENKNIIYSRGQSPEGDDPNDILTNDFNVENLLGRVGRIKWDRFLEIKRLLKSDLNAEEKDKLITEFFEIGNSYKFPVNNETNS